MPIDQWTCEGCGGVFATGWSDAAALAEARALLMEGPYGVLCDDCHHEYLDWARERGLVPQRSQPDDWPLP
jgi:hypothetical protein